VEKSKKKTYINAAIIISIMVFFRFIPPIDPITPLGMTVLGIFLGCIYAWIIGEIAWPSLLALILLGFTEGQTVTGVFSIAYGNSTLHMVLFCMLLCYGIEKTQLIDVITRFILSLNFVQKGPWQLCLAFWIAGAVASAITVAPIAVILLCYPIFYDVAQKLNLEKRSPFVVVTLIGISMFSFLGGNSMPYSSLAQVCFGVFYSAMPGQSVPFGAYILSFFSIIVIALVLMLLFCKVVLRVKTPDVEIQGAISTERISLNQKQKIMIVYLILMAVMMILPTFLPDTMALKGILNNLGTTGIFVVIGLLMSLTITNNGEKMMDYVDGMKYGMSWSLYFLLATALTVSKLLTSDATGINAVLVQILTPLIAGRSEFVFFAILIVLTIIMASCFNNLVCVTLLTPIICTFAEINGANPTVMITLLCITFYQAFIMPGGSSMGAFMHGQTEWLSSPKIYKYGALMELGFALILIFIGIPITKFFYSIF